MDATLNVRMDAALKERGDKILREHEVSASVAVRALWQEMVSTRALPAFLVEATSGNAEKKTKARALGQLVGVAQGSLSNLSDAELDAVGMARYE